MVRINVRLEESVMRKVAARLRGATDKVPTHRVSVGIHEYEGGSAKKTYNYKDSDLTLVEIAREHEFGAGNIPDRSWLRTWFDGRQGELKNELKEAVSMEFLSGQGAMESQSSEWAMQLRNWISEKEGNLEPLSGFTITKKASFHLSYPEVPLLATGQLVGAIKAQVNGRDA